MSKTGTESHKEQNRFEKEIRETLWLMKDGPLDSRIGAWENLKDALGDYKGQISQELASELSDILLEEKDEAVASLASRIMPTVTLRSQQGTQKKRLAQIPKNLGGWLWHDFHEPSCVLRAVGPDRLRRDEVAVIEIARSLPRARDPDTQDGFSDTQFLFVDSDGFAPDVVELEKIAAFCFVGRMSLFGKGAVKSWGAEDHPWRHRFAMESRPIGLPRGQLHPKYHAVLKHSAETDGKPTYRTDDTKTERTDYGLIRRYVVPYCGRCRVIVHIAGCSSLGTQAAAYFAAYSLFLPGLNKKLIPTPPGVNSKSFMEALIRVNAKTEGSEFGWKLQNLDLLDLRVGNFRWNESKFLWEPTSLAEIDVTFANEAAKRDYLKEPSNVDICIDEHPASFQVGSENRRLCLALCMLAEKQKGLVPLEDLVNDRQIWVDNKLKDVDVRYVAGRLRVLKQLKNLLDIENGTCRVLAKIHVEVRNPNKPR